MASLIPRSSIGFDASQRYRERVVNSLTVGKGAPWSKEDPNRFMSTDSPVFIRSSINPMTVGPNHGKSLTTPRNQLCMALEYARRRPNFVESRLRRHITCFQSCDHDPSITVAEYIVHFSDGTVVGLQSVEYNDKNRNAYRKYRTHGELIIITVVVRTDADHVHCIQDTLNQIAWNAKILFGSRLNKHMNHRQNGQPRAKYRNVGRSSYH